MTLTSRANDDKNKRNAEHAERIAAKGKTKGKKRTARASRQSARDNSVNDFARAIINEPKETAA